MLIADSGATKTDWRLLHPNGKVEQSKSAGLHPVHHTPESMGSALSQLMESTQWPTPDQVFFYGSGCAEASLQEKVKQAFRTVFGETPQIEVNHDVLAAARALCGTEAGIACILGTGSSACFFDGTEIVTLKAGNGILLGDEGSGAHLGKQLIAAYLNGSLPTDLTERFEKRFPDRRPEIIGRVYGQPNPGEYLGTFTQFMLHLIQHPWVFRTVYDCFTRFLELSVKPLASDTTLPIHFTGRTAFYFSNVLIRAVQDQQLRMGRLLETPIAGLTLYHQKAAGIHS